MKVKTDLSQGKSGETQTLDDVINTSIFLATIKELVCYWIFFQVSIQSAALRFLNSLQSKY